MDELFAVRSDLLAMTRALLQGPLESGELLDAPPSDTYLTGILWPRETPLDAAEDDADLNRGSSQDGENETGVPGYRAIRPCSIGITFATRPDASLTITLGQTARYTPSADRLWQRKQLGYSATVARAESSGDTVIQEFALPDGSRITDSRISLRVRRRVYVDQHVFTVTLVNEVAPDTELPRDAACLFQAEIVVDARADGVPAIIARATPHAIDGDEEELSNALLYRDVREHATGHGVAAAWEVSENGNASEVRTTWTPLASVPATSTAGHYLLEGFQQQHPDALKAQYLGEENNRAAATAALGQFVGCYQSWIRDTLESQIDSLPLEFQSVARTHMGRCVKAQERMLDGVALLRSDESAWTAFSLANRAMATQAMFQSKGSERRALVWRPFQLAFMLLVLPGLVDPSRDDRGDMDLLWFPTGGGKTEAYLGLTAFQIFLRRLTSSARRSTGGVDVLMRYTLRLLTVQQFQRAAALIAACDLLRSEDPRLGQARISLGLYVGAEATPNRMEDAREALTQEQAGKKPKSTPRQLLRCPVCGNELGSRAYRPHPSLTRIDIVCEGTQCDMRGRPLPVLTVDEAIYSEPPSLLIGTIDKFAQIPRRTDVRTLFGLDGGLPPSLIVQDELHLISGPLGSIAGLYETVVDTLCTRNGTKPKVIGSTATIGHAEAQVRSLFDRTVFQFPPPGVDASDSFFAVRDTKAPDRQYLGLSSAGRSPKFALQAVVAALLESASAQLTRWPPESVDPYWTCVAYFNSLRELGGAYVLMQDDVPRQMVFLARRLEAEVRDLPNPPVELSSRRSSRELPEMLHALSATLPAFIADPFESPQPKDTVLASNMISVGVDVPRLGLMVVNGQPKSTAEYIQASSRVGRGIPGLVVTLYNFGRPRDLSHFEHFSAYHGALYREVEATSVTPWAPRARDKALHAVLASLVRHLVPGLDGDEDAIAFDSSNPVVTEIVNDILKRVEHSVGDGEAEQTRLELKALVEEWARRSHEARTKPGKLRYWMKKAPFGKTSPHLMCSAEEAATLKQRAWPTPNTMRDVEPSTAFALKQIGRKAD